MELKTTVGAYTKALDNSRELSEVRDQLASKRSSFAEEDLRQAREASSGQC